MLFHVLNHCFYIFSVCCQNFLPPVVYLHPTLCHIKVSYFIQDCNKTKIAETPRAYSILGSFNVTLWTVCMEQKKTNKHPQNQKTVCLIKCPLLWSIITSLFPGASSLIQQTFLSFSCTHQTDISLGSRELSSTQEGIKKSGLPFQILAFLLMSTLGNVSWAMFSQSSSCLTHFLDLLVFPYLMTGVAFNLNQLCLNQAVTICSVVLNYTSAHYVWITVTFLHEISKHKTYWIE